MEVGSSILPSPTKAYSIPDKESDELFLFVRYSQRMGADVICNFEGMGEYLALLHMLFCVFFRMDWEVE